MIDKVNAISFKNGILLGEIHVEDGATTRIIKNVSKVSTKPFVEAVHKAMDIFRAKNNSSGEKATATISLADEIKKYKELLDEGVITESEFEKLKSKLLN